MPLHVVAGGDQDTEDHGRLDDHPLSHVVLRGACPHEEGADVLGELEEDVRKMSG